MTGNPSERYASIDGPVVVVHPRRLVAETLCIALRSIGIDADIDPTADARYALVDTRQVAEIARLVESGTDVIAFGPADTVAIARAQRAGAAWQVGDDIGFDRMADHLVDLASGKRPARLSERPASHRRSPLDDLTRREREVLQSLLSGRRAAEIAESDFVSVTTVRNQIQSILTKLGVHSQLEAVAMAVRAGWSPLAA